MKDIPIIFSAPMVLALLSGRKTMTRRLAWRDDKLPDNEGIDKSPSLWQRVQPGDRLWVKENFRNQQTSAMVSAEGARRLVCIDYGADGTRTHWNLPESDCTKVLLKRGRGLSGEQTALISCLNMPRIISRLTLVVTATKIEPLLDISENDAKAEGFSSGKLDDGFEPRDIGDGWTVSSPGAWASAGGHFQLTWAKLHPDWDGYSSPDVVALSFNVERSNIDRVAA